MDDMEWAHWRHRRKTLESDVQNTAALLTYSRGRAQLESWLLEEARYYCEVGAVERGQP